MSEGEILALAKKIREGTATPEETLLFFTELKIKVDDFNNYISFLKKE